MIAIIQYNAGNTASVYNAIKKLGYDVVITDDAATLQRADKIIFPGVGHANYAMKYLKEKKLDLLIPILKQPVLGICLGMQLLCRSTEEGDIKGLGIFDVDVKHFPAKDLVPHTGWNNLEQVNGTLFEGSCPNPDFYFVHSYYADICVDTISVTNYIVPFSAAMQKNNFHAVQFHPEKSGEKGMQLLNNFLKL